MKTLIVSMVALTAMTSATLADVSAAAASSSQPVTNSTKAIEPAPAAEPREASEPMVLSAEELDEVNAGFKPLIVFAGARLGMKVIDKIRGRDGVAHAPTLN